MAAFYGKKRPLVTDSNFDDTVFLLKTTSVQNNNTFLDSSSNNFAITRSGNVTQGSFSPFSRDPGYWSNYFDGTGDYLTVVDNTALQMSGDFTWEAWVYPLSAPSGVNYKTFWGQRANNTAFGGPCVVIDSSRNLLLFISNAAANGWGVSGFDTGLDIMLNSWQHLALVKSGTTVTLYINGTAGTSTTHSTAVGTSGNLSIMAGAADGVQAVDGYMSNFRIVKGTAVYTSNFTPSTLPLTAITNTSLLTCQNNNFKDNSANNFTITRNGDVKVTTVSPFSTSKKYDLSTSGASAYFDGNGDYLTGPTGNATLNSALDILGGDFTVEFWWYSATANPLTAIVTNFTASGVNGWDIGSRIGGIMLNIWNNNSKTEKLSAAVGITANTWYHIAVVNLSNNYYFYVNGIEVGMYSGYTRTALANPGAGTGLGIGAYIQNLSFANYTNGYISNLRIVKGTAVYTTNFTPSTLPLTAIANTSLLLRFNNQAVYDATGNNVIETVNALSSNSITLFGKNTMYFDGTGDYLSVPADPMFTFGTGNFTIEGFFYLSSNTGNYRSIITIPNTSGALTIRFGDSGSYNSLFQVSLITTAASNVYSVNFNQASALNQWVYFAFTRQGSTCRVFINGVQQNVATGTNPSTFTNSTFTDAANIINNASVSIGEYIGQTTPFIGYISELRITRGVDRYRQSFTVPTQSLTAITNTSLLTANNSTILDSSSNRFAITVNGDARVAAASPFAPNDNNYSVFFDGTGDYLSTPSNVAFALPGDFTVEAWVYIAANSALDGGNFRNAVIASTQQSGPTDGFTFQINGSSAITGTSLGVEFRVSGANTGYASTTVNIPQTTWNHIAFVRSGTTITYYLNGTNIGTSTASQNIPTGGALTIGGQTIASYNRNLNGYISNLRIVKGTAVYTANFIPSNIPLTAITNTSLLTCQSPLFNDNSSNNFAVTVFGNTTTRRFSPFITFDGSVSFDGTGDWLIIPYNVNLVPESGNFTIEMWFYTTNGSTRQDIYSMYTSTSGIGIALSVTSARDILVYRGDTQLLITAGSVWTANTWNHLAVSRNETTLRIFINGTQIGTTTNSTNITGSTALYIGAAGNATFPYTGHLSNIRFVKGTAVYTSNFTPPTQPLTAITNTVLLTGQGSVIKDYSNNHVISTFGNSTPVGFSPNDLGSMYFDGSSDYLSVNFSTNPTIAGNFTWETWVYDTGATANGTLLGWRNGSGAGWQGIIIQRNANSNIITYINQTGGLTLTQTSNTYILNQWNHVALVRSGSTVTLYVNGTIAASGTYSGTFTPGTSYWIGSDPFNNIANVQLQGFVSNQRFVNGTAVYTSNFTPPTLEFPIRGTTS